jgi:hypothetical protein
MSPLDTYVADWGEAMSSIEKAGQEAPEKQHQTYISEEDKLNLSGSAWRTKTSSAR